MNIVYELEPGAYAPRYAHEDDAGMDLFAPEDFSIAPSSNATIDTGVHIMIPIGFCGLMVSKSGININKSCTSTGLIDAGYTGTVHVKLYNNNQHTWQFFKKGDKISQIVILPVPSVTLVPGDVKSTQTERGNGAFGSTGR